MLRRLAAIALQLLVLQLALRSGAAACPSGDEMAGAAAMTMPGAEGSHAGHPGSNAREHGHSAPDAPAGHRHQAGHCDMTCAPADCAAAGHCSTVAASDDADPAVLDAARRGIAPRSEGIHASVSTAPEPPPPRA